MSTGIILVMGIILFVLSIGFYHGTAAFAALIACFLSVTPIIVCGPPPPFSEDKILGYHSLNRIFEAYDIEQRRLDIGYFFSGACAMSSICIIILLWTLGKSPVVPSILAIMGLIVISFAVLFYLCCFNTPKCDDDDDDEDNDHSL